MDPRRTSAGNTRLGLKSVKHLEKVVARCDELADEARAAFHGLLEPVWINEYVATRIEPLREELAAIQASLLTGS